MFWITICATLLHLLCLVTSSNPPSSWTTYKKQRQRNWESLFRLILDTKRFGYDFSILKWKTLTALEFDKTCGLVLVMKIIFRRKEKIFRWDLVQKKGFEKFCWSLMLICCKLFLLKNWVPFHVRKLHCRNLLTYSSELHPLSHVCDVLPIKPGPLF